MPRILVVDDDTSVRLVLIEILFDAGYEVDAAHSFSTGAAILRSGPKFDLLVTDSGLADGTGTALADQAKSRGIPALIVTGNEFSVDATKYSVLAKPMRSDALLAAVKAVLSDGAL